MEEPVTSNKWFQEGLHPSIRNQVLPLNLQDYNELYARAQMIEKYMMEHVTSMLNQVQTPPRTVNRDKKYRGKQPFIANKKRRGSNGSQSEACHYCGRQHDITPCRVRTGACF